MKTLPVKRLCVSRSVLAHSSFSESERAPTHSWKGRALEEILKICLGGKQGEQEYFRNLGFLKGAPSPLGGEGCFNEGKIKKNLLPRRGFTKKRRCSEELGV